MKLIELIDELFKRDIQVWISAEALRYKDPNRLMTPELEAKLDQYSPTILAYLRSPEGEAPPFYPLSAAQKRLWYLHQLIDYNAATQNIKFEARLLSKPDIPALGRALQKLVDRHPALRTTYPSLHGTPVQQIQDQMDAHFEVFESAKWKRAQLSQTLNDVYNRPLNLRHGPMLRTYLFKLPRGKSILWLFIPLLAADFLSAELLLEELSQFYIAEKQGMPLELEPIEHQYLDYIHWKMHMLDSDEGKAHLHYLTQLLSGELPVLNLPSDNPRPPVQTYNTSSLFLTLTRTLSNKLKELAKAEQTSLYTILVSAFFVLLHRYTGQQDILIGSPRAEQGHRHFKGVVGYFENPVPLRANLAGNPTFRDFHRQMHKMVWEAFDHEDYPSHLLARQLRLKQDASHPPLYQAIFILQEQHQRNNISPFILGQGGERIELDGLVMQAVGLDERMMIFVDLQLNIFEEQGELTALWQYNSDLFYTETIERMGDNYRALLEEIVETPEHRVSTVPTMSAEERHKVLIDWNATAASYPRERCVHELFEAQVEETPQAIAVISGEGQVTYQEVNARANQLANYLQMLGVSPDELVGLCLERSLEMVIGVLGILKAGGAYVPLDPEYPKERLELMLEDAQVHILVTQETLAEAFQTRGDALRIIQLDSGWETVSQASTKNAVSHVTPEHLAYVIYTSGSTGRPKGVAMPHRPLCNLISWQKRQSFLSEAARTLQFAPISFDVSFQEMFSTWSTGGTLILITESLRKNPAELLQFLEEQQVQRLYLPFVALQQLADMAAELKRFPAHLQDVITAGEQLQITPSVRSLFAHLPECRLHNHYGPSETHVVTAYTLPGAVESWPVLPSIGRPIANTQMYMLDQSLEPVPMGVPGGLYIGGDNLARGYLHRPDLTEERFIPNPIQYTPSPRLYATGDLVRYLPDGNIEFLGRMDDQVKIRGFRIELGEIESTIAAHPAVKETVVLIHKDEGGKRLIAYIVPDTESETLQQELQDEPHQQEHVSQWEHLYDSIYSQPPATGDPEFNMTGYTSSYTQEPIPEEDMREWVEGTVERVLSLHPQRILEIGCGTGLFLFRLAPHCQAYWGTELSTVALDLVRQYMQNREQDLPGVQLRHQTAENFEGLSDEPFDVILLNSVVPCFPGIAYLLNVVRGAVQTIAPGKGVIFLGDVRSLPLMEAYHTSVQEFQSPEFLPLVQLRQRIHREMSLENQLFIAPECFPALKQEFPEITHVLVQPRRGKHDNEFTRFRYDAILYINTEIPEQPDHPWLDWQEEQLSLYALDQRIRSTQPDILGLANVPNARLTEILRMQAALQAAQDRETTADLRSAVSSQPVPPGVDPEGFWKLGKHLSYLVDISWARSGGDGSYDVLLRRQTPERSNQPPIFPEHEAVRKPWIEYANNPLQASLSQTLTPQIRRLLHEKLPEYMVPSDFVILDEFPLTPSGKINRRELPVPERVRPDLDTEYVEAKTEVEQIVAQVWRDLLDLDRVGIHDNFLDLGGDSLSMTRMITRLQERFEMKLPVVKLFGLHTIATLAEVIEGQLEHEIDQLSEEEMQRLLEEE